MATSGIYALDLTLNEGIYEAYDLLQVAADGEPVSGDLYNRAVRELNRMLKLWQSQGIHLWTFTEGSLFLRVGKARYDFNDEGMDTTAVHLANLFTQTTTTADATTADRIVSLTSVEDLSVGDQLGIVANDLDLDWYLVMEINGLDVTLDATLEGDADSGAVVYHYDYLPATTLDASELLGATVLNVADTSIFNQGNDIRVLLDDDTVDDREIASIDEGAGTITITVGLTSAASSGNAVLNLTTRRNGFKPITRLVQDSIRRYESTDYEIPIVDSSRKEYFDLPNKNQNGTPIQAYYDRQQGANNLGGVMYLWNPPSSSKSVINFSYERQIQIFDGTDPDQTFDLPQSWLDAVVYQLAKRLRLKVGCSAARAQMIAEAADTYLDNALGFDQSMDPIRMVPQKYG